jgi:hypothetical protein
LGGKETTMRVGDRIRRRADGATGTIVCVVEAEDYTAAVARMDGGGFISFLGEENDDTAEEKGGDRDGD